MAPARAAAGGALSRRVLAACAMYMLAACARPPARPEPDPRREPAAAIAAIFAEAIPGNPHAPPFRENEVASATAEAITWRPLEPPGAPERTLRFVAIDAIEFHVEAELPSRPEAIFIYLRGDEGALEEAGAIRVPLASIGLGRPYLALHRRPPGSCRRLREALEALGFTPGRF
jgi:hypothetical protein